METGEGMKAPLFSLSEAGRHAQRQDERHEQEVLARRTVASSGNDEEKDGVVKELDDDKDGTVTPPIPCCPEKGLYGMPAGVMDFLTRLYFDNHLTNDAYEDPENSSKLKPSSLYNPIYWILFWVFYFSSIPGFFMHMAIGQDVPVRPDEVYEEKEIRIQWIYSADGVLFYYLCTNALLELYGLMIGKPSIDGEGAFCTVVWTCMIVANVYAYEAMKNRDQNAIRIIIAANTAFSVSTCLLFVMNGLLYWVWGRTHDGTETKRGVVFSRLLLVIFNVMMARSYKELWNLYPAKEGKKSLIPGDKLPILVWVAVFVLFFIGALFSNGEFIWTATA